MKSSPPSPPRADAAPDSLDAGALAELLVLEPGGRLAFDACFPGLRWIGAPNGTRLWEAEFLHPETGPPVRLRDSRTFDRVEQLQHSLNEVELLDAAGEVAVVHAALATLRWIYKSGMELLLELAGFCAGKFWATSPGVPSGKKPTV